MRQDGSRSAWRCALAEVTPFSAFSDVMCKIISTTNAEEALNRVLRKILKIKTSYQTEEAATKLIRLAIRVVVKRGPTALDWVAARHQLAMTFAGRSDAWPWLKTA